MKRLTDAADLAFESIQDEPGHPATKDYHAPGEMDVDRGLDSRVAALREKAALARKLDL